MLSCLPMFVKVCNLNKRAGVITSRNIRRLGAPPLPRRRSRTSPSGRRSPRCPWAPRRDLYPTPQTPAESSNRISSGSKRTICKQRKFPPRSGGGARDGIQILQSRKTMWSPRCDSTKNCEIIPPRRRFRCHFRLLSGPRALAARCNATRRRRTASEEEDEVGTMTGVIDEVGTMTGVIICNVFKGSRPLVFDRTARQGG